MLGLKKRNDAAAAAEAAGAAAGAESGGPKVSLFGKEEARVVEGAGGSGGGGAVKKKMKPAEIRLVKDIAELEGGKVAQCTLPDKSDLTQMQLRITPDQGLWRGATFDFSISVPDAYPHAPPKVHCNTKIYHPNIDLEGHVCLNILRDEWKPVLTINTVIYGMIFLFNEPNPNDPLNKEAAATLRDNKAQFEKNVFASLRGGSVGGTAFPKLL